MTAPVTVLGEALIDTVVAPSGQVAEHVGGSPANVAVGVARLGHQTALVTHIGTDERGRRIAALLASEGVTLAAESASAHHTATATAYLDEAGMANYEFDLEWQVDARTAIPPGSHVHTGSIAATLSPGAESVRLLVQGARQFSTVSYDPNARPSLMGEAELARSSVEQMVTLADIVKASDEDIRWLYPGAAVVEVLHKWASLGPRLCIATGGGGDVVVLVAGEIHQVPTRTVPVVDTVGAGDSFMAGLISGLLDAGLLGSPGARAQLEAVSWTDVLPALQLAIECSAVTVGRAGANPPKRGEIA